MDKYKSVDGYIEHAPKEAQEKLNQLRKIIKEAAPEATEKISYGMPYYELNGRLAYFGYAKNHIGLYPMAAGVEYFKTLSSDYETSKGTIKFPLDKPLPEVLISKLIDNRAVINKLN